MKTQTIQRTIDVKQVEIQGQFFDLLEVFKICLKLVNNGYFYLNGNVDEVYIALEKEGVLKISGQNINGLPSMDDFMTEVFNANKE